MTVILVWAALVVGYIAGRHQLAARTFDAVEDWVDRRTGRAARWAVQPIYAMLIGALFISSPTRFVRNLHANRRHETVQFTGAMKTRTPRGDDQ